MRRFQYSRFLRDTSTLLLLSLVSGLCGACGDGAPDPRTVRGALDAAAQAIEANDPARLFRVIDQRARYALASIVHSRVTAKQLIEADYPANERASALAQLGDAALASSPADLFAHRCDAACMADFGRQIGAPTAEENTGGDVVVHTARGGTLHMHAGKDGWYGLVWNTDALDAERSKATRDLDQIRQNATAYRLRRTLDSTAY